MAVPVLRIVLRIDSPAFEQPATETGRILRALADRIEAGELPPLPLMDANGCSVGWANVHAERDDIWPVLR